MRKTCCWEVFILNYHWRKIYFNNFVSNQRFESKVAFTEKKQVCVKKKYTCHLKLDRYRKNLFHLLTCIKFSRVKEQENMSGTVKKPTQKTIVYTKIDIKYVSFSYETYIFKTEGDKM